MKNLYESRCLGCGTNVALAPELLTGSTSGLFWDCPHCERVQWDEVLFGPKLLWWIASGASWGAEDPLTDADIAEFVIELAACGDPVGRLMAEVSA